MTTQSEMTTVPNNHDDQDRKLAVEPDSVDRLLNELAVTNTKPLWVQMTKLNPPQPAPKTIPFIWRFDDIRPYLIRAGELVTEKQAERRVLMLVNPAMGRIHTVVIKCYALKLILYRCSIYN
jgi:gentisate 1,2-dioxygenase